jgi:hypothetical protein
MSVSLFIIDPHAAPTTWEVAGDTVLHYETIDTGINLANGRAAAVLKQLGLFKPEQDWWSGCAGDLLLACQRWLQGPGALLADEGVAPVVTKGEGAVFVGCGLPPGYFATRITQFRDAALRAIGLGGYQTDMFFA